MSSTPITSTPPKAPSYSAASINDSAVVMDDAFNKVATVHRRNGDSHLAVFQLASMIAEFLTKPVPAYNGVDLTKERDYWKDHALKLEGRNDIQAKSVADLTRQCEGYRRTTDDIGKTRDDLNRLLEAAKEDNVDLGRQFDDLKKDNTSLVNQINHLQRQLEEAKKATPATTQHAAHVPIEYRLLSSGAVACTDKTGGIIPAPNDVVVIGGSRYRVAVNYFNYDATGRQVGVTTWVVGA